MGMLLSMREQCCLRHTHVKLTSRTNRPHIKVPNGWTLAIRKRQRILASVKTSPGCVLPRLARVLRRSLPIQTTYPCVIQSC